eukprot:365673-Chlamydomonas_euryale.AAC.11
MSSAENILLWATFQLREGERAVQVTMRFGDVGTLPGRSDHEPPTGLEERLHRTHAESLCARRLALYGRQQSREGFRFKLNGETFGQTKGQKDRQAEEQMEAEGYVNG